MRKSKEISGACWWYGGSESDFYVCIRFGFYLYLILTRISRLKIDYGQSVDYGFGCDSDGSWFFVR